MAEVAIRNMAPIRVDRLPAFITLSGVFRPAAGASRRAYGLVGRVTGFPEGRRGGRRRRFEVGIDMAVSWSNGGCCRDGLHGCE